MWDMATLARKRNHGSRVDFLLAASPQHVTDSAERNVEGYQEVHGYWISGVSDAALNSAIALFGLPTVHDVQEGAQQPFDKMFTDVRIWSGFEGSDHAPVWADLQLPEPLPMGEHPPALNLANRRTTAGAGTLQVMQCPS